MPNEPRKNEAEILTDAIGMDAFEHLPVTSSDALAAASASQSHLAAALPPGELKNYPGQPPMVSRAEQTRFMLEHTIATNPEWVLDRANDGTLSEEIFGVFKKYYPQMHADVSNRLREQSQYATTYQQRLLIASLTGDPTTPDTEPMSRAILSQPVSADPAGGQPQGPGQSATRPHSSRSLQGHGLSSSTGSMTSVQKTAFGTKE